MRYEKNSRETAQFLRSRQVYSFIREETRDIAQAARRIAPVDDGDYLAGIDTSFQAGWTDGRATGRVNATAPHSAAVEWGNRHRRAQRVLRRAAGGTRK